MRNNWMKLVVLIILTLSFGGTVGYAAVSEVHYSDVPVGHWARKAVEELGARGIVLGTGDEKFTPDRLMTRGEFERVLARVLGKDLAVGTGVSRKEITREEAFVLVGRRLGELGLVPAGDYENPYVYLYRFGDYWKVSAWARPSVGMGVKLGLVTGDVRGMLVPQGRMTRAEAAVLVWRLVGKIEMVEK